MFLKLMGRHFHRYLLNLPSIYLRLYHLPLMLLILDQRLRHYLPKLYWNGYQLRLMFLKLWDRRLHLSVSKFLLHRFLNLLIFLFCWLKTIHCHRPRLYHLHLMSLNLLVFLRRWL